MFQLCGNMKTMMTDLSRDRLFRPPRSSSRGAQADLDATEDDNDDDDGAPVAQRGRYGWCWCMVSFFCFCLFFPYLLSFQNNFIIFIHKTFVCIVFKTLVPSVWHFIFWLLNTTSYIYLDLFEQTKIIWGGTLAFNSLKINLLVIQLWVYQN